MPTFNLNTAFTNEQLSLMYMTGTNVVVAKPAQGGRPNVAWQVFRPLTENTLSWKEEYGLYASTASMTNGAVLSRLSYTNMPSEMNKMYTLEPSAIITGPANGGHPNHFGLLNNYSARPYMTAGLFQDAIVNGQTIHGNAVSAAPILSNSIMMMNPYTTIYIWLQSQVVSNSVVTTVTSPMTRLDFGGSVNNISVAYDSASGTFRPAGNAQMLTSDAGESLISHLEASL